MRSRAVGLVVAVAWLSPLVLACCFFSSSDGVPLVPPTLGVPGTLAPLAPPLVGGSEHQLLGRTLVVDVPMGTPPNVPAELEPGIAGHVGAEHVWLGDDGPVLAATRLPCVSDGDLAGGAERELLRRHPGVARPVTVRTVATRDASLSVVELVPASPLVVDLDERVAFFAADLRTHVVWIPVIRRASGRADLGATEQVRQLAESIVGTMRRGDWVWEPANEGPTYGDLFGGAELPRGWVVRSSGCCNEEPPYLTRFRETLMPMRSLGGVPRARVTARAGVCPAGAPERAGTMHGAPMTWSRTATGLCWVERLPGPDELGVSWHVRGATDADLDEALRIASTARHDWHVR